MIDSLKNIINGLKLHAIFDNNNLMVCAIVATRTVPSFECARAKGSYVSKQAR